MEATKPMEVPIEMTTTHSHFTDFLFFCHTLKIEKVVTMLN